MRETGVKGCYLVEIHDGQTTAQFRETDVMRWELVAVALTTETDLEALFASVESQLRAAAKRATERFLAIRLHITGSCKAHDQLEDDEENRAAAVARIRQMGKEISDEIWIEKVRLDTAPVFDWVALRRGNDLFAELLQAIDEIAESDQDLKLLADNLQSLSKKAGPELDNSGIRLDDPEELRRWLRNAESLLFPLIADTKDKQDS